MTVRRRKQMCLAVRLPGAGSATAYAGPRATYAGPRGKSPLALPAFEHLARTAERGRFDLLFLPGGPRPEPVTVLSALAAVTERVGLAATVDATRTEPYDLARRLATLDHLSGGRAAWHVATSRDQADRYGRATELVATAQELWDTWTPDGVSRPFAHRGAHFDIAGEFGVPRSPQGHPVVIHAGDSDECREFAASTADVLLGRHGSPEAGRAFYADVKRRLATYGRAPDDLKIMAGVTVVLGDTATGARERELSVRRSVSGAGGGHFLVGTPESVAAELDALVRDDAADGFVLLPYLAPGGLDEFVDRVVPLLQERGAFRTEYTGATLRSHLGLHAPAGKG
ncbi:LLM class flavin-dependent oxidoreductase [Streptomyces sp. NPDC001982]|uniref:LLM class flavin-dependent oxidoreductase n=1 Tax=Streptomyces sp. NPDC001982 TaxID=3154405 RepID=UPI00331EFBB6